MSLLFSRSRGRSPGLNKQGDARRAGRTRRALSLELMESRTLMTGTITPLVNPVPNGSGTMMLETNGTVITVAGGDSASKQYYVLTPDAQGNYVDGNWTEAASSGLERLFNGSVILPDGRMIVLGGEYAGPNTDEAFTNEGEIYTPSTNTWAPIATFPQSMFGDDELVNLGNGNVLAGYLAGPQTYLYNANTNTWTQTGTKLFGDQSDEEGFVELPNGNFLDYSIFSSLNNNVGQGQVYSPSTGQWTATGNLPSGLQLTSVASGYELGGGELLPDGRVFWIGANNQTAYYTPATNSWTAGPDLPDNLVQDDATTTELTNGKILFSADTIGFQGPTHFFEYDPVAQTFTDISSEFPSGYLDGPAFLDRELNLPNGQILINNGGNDLLLYTPDSGALSSNIPAIKSISQNPNGSFTLTGTTINGNNDGSVYGDDAQMATNYPIVSFTSASGQVSYATTYGFNYAVEQGSTPETTQFTLPLGLPQGVYSVRVLANGAASAPMSLALPTKTNDPAPTIATPATATPNPVITTSTQLSVLGADTAGENTLTYTWTTTASPAGVPSPTFAVNGSNAAKSDTATFYAVGSYTFQVTATNLAGLSVSSSVTVKVNAKLTSLALSPTDVQLSPNQTEQFNVAAGLDQFGNQITTSSLSWAITSGNGTITQSGLYTAPPVGTIASVKVSSGNVSQTATIYVLSNPWSQTDVGSPNVSGNAADNGNGLFTLLGGGTGISGTSDQLQFAYLTLTGNSTIETQVATVQNTNAAAEAGISFRNDTTAGSMNVTIAITPSSGLVFSYRTQAGGNTVILSTARVVPGDYVKIIRVGNIFTGYYSLNGTTWTQVGGSVNVAMNSNAFAGLVVTSNNASTLNTSTFNHVLADSTPTIVTAASANPNPVSTTRTTLSVLGGDSAGESALSYTWVTTSLPPGTIAPTFATNGTNASKNDVVTFTKAGTYTFMVTVANALGYSVTSSVTVKVVPTQTIVILTPLSATVMEGQTQQFTAAAYDQFGIKLVTQPRFTYSMIAGGAGGKVSSTGLYTAPLNKTGFDYLNVTGAGTASVAKITVIMGIGSLPGAATKSTTGQAATVGQVSVGWGSNSASLVTAADGLRLLPAGRQVDIPWANIQTLTVAFNHAVPLSASNVRVTGIAVANYGPVTVTPVPGSPGTYLITLAEPIAAADRVTLTIAGSQLSTYTRRLDVLPGDVNDDGIVNATDASIASGYLLTTYISADLFGDGVVSARDVREVQLLNGTKLPLLS